ncbi:MAG TPA: hypothetical protein VMT15_02685 [Bryobacteraceae bacterium]|nr:hypothetical protein [Bryobacteraceae bacterium]
MTKAPSIFLMFTMLAGAAPPDLSAWKYRKKIPLTPGDGIAVIKLDKEVYAAVGSRYDKLRIYRDHEEVSFVFTDRGRNVDDQPPSMNTELLDQVIVPGEGLQFVVRGQGQHNNVKIYSDRKNYWTRVRIETGDDGRHWSIARNDGAIFNFMQDGRELQSTDVGYPVSTKKLLRVTLFGWTKIGSVTSTGIRYRVEPLTEESELFATVKPQAWEDEAAKSTFVLVDTGQQGLPVTALRVLSPSQQFLRAVSVESSGDSKVWTFCGSGTLKRLPGPRFTEESLVVYVSGGNRYYRMRISNFDDKPIQIDAVQAEGPVYQMKFLAATPGNYWLYYDGPGPEYIAMPHYDLPVVLAKQSLSEHLWTLDRQEANPIFHEPEKPWSERHPVVLYTVLGIAVAGLGIVTYRFAMGLRRLA